MASVAKGSFNIFSKRKVDTEKKGPTFSFYGYPYYPWKFDRVCGFNYGKEWLGGQVVDGSFDSCQFQIRGNEYGNVGEVIGNYDKAEVKILFFGSSYTVTEMTNQIQEMLTEQLDKSVCILNFWRDSTGIQNHFDIAQNVAGKLKPNLMILAFNSLGYAFPRAWRPIIKKNEHFWYWYQSRNPDLKKIDPTRAYLQPFVITDLVTKEWCEKMNRAKQASDEKTLREDAVVKRMIEEYERILEEKERMVREHGQPNMQIEVVDFRKDPQFMKAVKYVEGLAVPYLLVHVQMPPEFELRKGGYVFKPIGVPEEQGMARARSLEEVTGKKVIHLIDYYDPKYLDDPFKLVTSERDWHPGKLGQKAMAEAFTKLIIEKTK